MLDFRDLLDGVDVTKKPPSDGDVGGTRRRRRETCGLFGFSVFLCREFARDSDGRDRCDGCADARDRKRRSHFLPRTAARARGTQGRSEPSSVDEREKKKVQRKRSVVSLHGDLPQSARDAAVARLRAGACDVLVATDVAARGLDLPGVELVIHADPPKDADAYAHRAGRAGRPGCASPGVSLLLAAPGSAATAATAALEQRAKIRLKRLSAIGEKVVVEKSVAFVRAAWEEKRRRETARVAGGHCTTGVSVGDGVDVETGETRGAPDETSLARLGERYLMDDRFDEFSVDLARIRGKKKGAGGGRGGGGGREKR